MFFYRFRVKVRVRVGIRVRVWVKVRVRVRVILSSVRDRGIERSGNRTLVGGVVTSRRYCQTNSAQALKD